MTDNADVQPGLNLLSLDGGGITGLSSLLIVREIMSRLQEQGRLDRTPDPWEYFDMIGGTGTGAISAVMLGRLHMSIADAISTYVRVMSNVFSDPKVQLLGGNGVFRATVLEDELKRIVRDSEVAESGEERLLEKDPDNVPCKVVVYAMSAINMTSRLPREFRSYSARPNALTDCMIWEALRASTTHPDLFKAFKTGNRGEQERFVQGALGCSNPTDRLLEEARIVFPNQKVASIVNIGTGHAQTIQVPETSRREQMLGIGAAAVNRVLKAAYEMASDNEEVAERMARRFANVEFAYYRLNVDQGMQTIEAKEWERLNEVSAHARRYLELAETKARLGKVVDAIRLRKAVLETALIDGRVAPSSRVVEVGVRQCPPPSARFTHREEPISIVISYFSSKAHKRRVFVLYGLGGAGKTQLALKCAELMEQRFTDIVFVDATSRESIEAALADFAISRQVGKTYQDTLRWLANRQGQYLLIFDNSDDPGVGLRNYLPRSSEYDILITSRHQGLVALAQKDATHNVSAMSTNEAQELLLKLAELDMKDLGTEEKESLDLLLQELGCLALAVAQAGAFILTTKRTISQYYNMYLKRRRELFQGEQTIALSLDGYGQTVYTTWDLSHMRLSSHAKQLLLLIAFLHKDGILEQIFGRASSQLQSYFPPVPLSPLQQKSQQEVTEFLETFEDSTGTWSDDLFLSCISEPVSLSLLTFDRVNQSYSLHPLVQDWARAMATDRAAAVERTSLLLALSTKQRKAAEDRAFNRAMVPHVNTMLSHTAGDNHQGQNVNHLSIFAQVYYETGHHGRELLVREQVVAAQKHTLGNEHPTTLTSTANLALAYDKRGRLAEAAELEESVLAARMRVLGDEHPATLMSMDNLAGTYQQLGQTAEAEKLYVSVLAARKRVIGHEHPDTLRSMGNLASTYKNRGHLAEAEKLEVSVMAALKRVLGDEHPDTLTSMNNLGGTYLQQGRTTDAEKLYVSVLAARKRVLGDEHPETLMSMANLAAAYAHQGRWPEAETLNVSMLAARKRLLGDEHPDTLFTMANLADTYRQLGRLAEAESLQASALATRRRVLGDAHPDTLSSMVFLALVYGRQGRFVEKEALEEQALAVRRQVLGNEHPDTITSMRNLAVTYRRRGRQTDCDALNAEANAIEARRK